MVSIVPMGAGYLCRNHYNRCHHKMTSSNDEGCTLDRSLRSDVCNSYFCGGTPGLFDTRRGGDTDHGHRWCG